jgi:hypothetical protein
MARSFGREAVVVRTIYDAETSAADVTVPPVEENVTCPLDADVIVIPEPATKAEVPLTSWVNDPERPALNL